MEPVSTAVVIFTGIKTGFETLSKGLELLKEAGAMKDESTFRKRVNEMQSQALDLEEKVIALRTTMQKQAQEILDLKDQIAQKNMMLSTFDPAQQGFVLDAKGLWTKDGRKYCPSCAIKRREMVIMTQEAVFLICPVCDKTLAGI